MICGTHVHIFLLCECLFLPPTIRLCSLFKVRNAMGALIMTYIEHMEKSFWLSRVSNTGPFDHEPAVLIIRTRRNPVLYSLCDLLIFFQGEMLTYCWRFKLKICFTECHVAYNYVCMKLSIRGHNININMTHNTIAKITRITALV